jgi:hypothetical protein
MERSMNTGKFLAKSAIVGGSVRHWSSIALLILALGVPGRTALASGTVVGWGANGYGQATPPAGLDEVVAIAAGGYHSLALRANGTVVGWGENFYGQATPPTGLIDVVGLAGGYYHSLALLADGTVVGWGFNFDGQATPPPGLSDVVAIAAGTFQPELHVSLALRGDGTVVGWGSNVSGQTTPPAGLTGVLSIAAGASHSLALINQSPSLAVNFSNGFSTLVYDVDGTTPLEGAYVAQLWAGFSPNEATFFPVGTPATFRTGLFAGIWNGSIVTIQGSFPGQQVYVQVRVWNPSLTPAYHDALCAGLPVGSSAILTLTMGVEGDPPVPLAGLTSFALASVPEKCPHAPTGVFLSNDSIDERQPPGTLVGVFTAADPNPGDTHFFALVSGSGDEDNHSFYIAGDELWTLEVFNYDSKSSYQIRVQATDPGGLSYETTFTIHITPDQTTVPDCSIDQMFGPSLNAGLAPIWSNFSQRAQTFTLGTSGRLVGFEIYLLIRPDSSAVLWEIRPAPGGIVSDQVLASGEIAPTGSTFQGFVSVAVPGSGVPVAAGDQLAIVLLGTVPANEPTMWWWGSGSDSANYEGGTAHIYNNSNGTWSSLAADNWFKVCVAAASNPPSFGFDSAPFTLLPGESFEFSFVVTDPDGDDVSVAGIGLPPGAVLSPSSGSSPLTVTFSWTPTREDLGLNWIEVEATDEHGASTLRFFKVYVVTAEANTLTGRLWIVPEEDAASAVPANVPERDPDVVFDILTPFWFQHPSAELVGDWLESGRAFNIQELTADTLGAPTKEAILEFAGYARMNVNEGLFIRHSGGMSLVVDDTDFGLPPDHGQATHFNWTGANGVYPFQAIAGNVGDLVMEMHLSNYSLVPERMVFNPATGNYYAAISVAGGINVGGEKVRAGLHGMGRGCWRK